MMTKRKNTIAARFAEIRAGSGLSKRAFAESLGIHPMVAGDIELGKRDPSRDVLIRLARAYNVDITWLLTGDRIALSPGEAHFSSDYASNRSDYASNRQALSPASQNASATIPVRLIRQEAAAGRGIEIDDYAESAEIQVPPSFISPYRGDRVRAVYVRGDSMTGAGLDDGDIVFFTVDERSGPGIFVVSVESALLVKRVDVDHAAQRVTLISENPQYAPRILSGADLDRFSIEGRVLASIHRH
jgi:phage repressor protein C with HTH and peptisase S24 domain